MRRDLVVVLFVVALVTSACQQKSADGDPPTGSATPPVKVDAAQNAAPKPDAAGTAQLATPACGGAGSCEQCVQQFEAWMIALVAEGHDNRLASVPSRQLAQLPITAKAARLPREPIVYLDGRAVSYGGVDAALWSADAEQQAKALARLSVALRRDLSPSCRRKSRSTPVDVILAVASSTPWTRVAQVAGAIDSAGADGVQFAFLQRSKLAKPGPSKLDAAIGARLRDPARVADPSTYELFRKKPSKGDLVETVYGSCARAMSEWNNVGEFAGHQDESIALAAVMPQALEACECKIDVASALSLHYFAAGRHAHPGMYLAGVRLPLAGDKPRRPLAADAELPWASAYPRVLSAVAGGHPSWLIRTGQPPGKGGTMVPRRRACKTR